MEEEIDYWHIDYLKNRSMNEINIDQFKSLNNFHEDYSLICNKMNIYQHPLLVKENLLSKKPLGTENEDVVEKENILTEIKIANYLIDIGTMKSLCYILPITIQTIHTLKLIRCDLNNECLTILTEMFSSKYEKLQTLKRL